MFAILMHQMIYVLYRLNDYARAEENNTMPLLRTRETKKLMLELAQSLEDAATLLAD